MRILVTGADGYIGRALADSLKGHEVIRFVGHSTENGIIADLSKDVPVVENIDVCFHCAAMTNVVECENNPGKAMDINAGGTRRVAEMLMHSSKPLFVYVSTLGVCNTYDPVNEQTPVNPQNAYARSKAEGELVVKEYSSYFPCVTVRLVFPYGGNSSKERLVSRLIMSVSKGEKIFLNNDAKPLINPIHVMDLLIFFHKLLNYRPNRYVLFNVGGPKVYSIRDLAKIIGITLKKPVLFNETNKTSCNYIADNSLAQKELGFKPKIDFREGIKPLV